MSTPIPFEKQFPQEAQFLGAVYAAGQCVPFEIKTNTPAFLPPIVYGGDVIVSAKPLVNEKHVPSDTIEGDLLREERRLMDFTQMLIKDFSQKKKGGE